MNYWLDTIKWVTDPETGESYYRHPAMVFDLRNLVDRGTPGLTAGRFVLCEGAVAPVGAVALGELGHALTAGERQSVRSVLGWTPSGTVADFIYQLVGPEADITGVVRCKPVRVGRGMRLKFKIGSLEYSRPVALADSDWARTVQMERLHYAGWRADVQAGRMPAGQHLRALDYLRAKYVSGRAQDEVDAFLSGVRGGLPDEGILPRSTTIQCNFNDADGVLESHANDDGGSGHLQGTWSWTATVSDWNIATNQASSAGSDNVATATASLSSDDHYSQFGFVSLSGAANLLTTNVRQADANNMYVGGYRNDNQWEIFERITGTFTQLGTDLSTNAVPSTSIKLSISDSTLELFRDGVSQGTRTDTSLTGTLTTGFRVTSSGAVIDDFEAADLAASTFDLDRIERRTMRGVMRGVGRGQ